MSTAVASPPPVADADLPLLPDEQRFLLTNVSWEFYERLLEELGDRHIRVTFDRGNLELMSPSYRHERGGSVLGFLVQVAFEELDIRFISGGSTTFKRKLLKRGLEGDDCFWVENVDRILGKDDIDLDIDPPPDISIEIDITRSSLDRMSIYAALRVPQVWRFDGEMLEVHCLRDDGSYELCDRSPTFPFLPLEKVAEFLIHSFDVDDLTLRREFRAWLRHEVLPAAGTGPDSE
ncbi:MAG: Uma2 family endonuclease [Planctomycetes bacterium]|nr:Uma2 family endonuclease [Planctomycetota bacterium]